MCYMEQKMQEQMEGAEHEYNRLMEEYEPPADWDRPQWQEASKVHNWRNYVHEELQSEWPSFTGRQKILLSSAFDGVASDEEWD